MNHIIILAGGKGTRMKTECPKVLNKITGKSFINRVLSVALGICSRPTIIVGYKGDEVVLETKNKYHYVWQREQLGTGHAIMCAKNDLAGKDIDNILVLNGDHPLVKQKTLKNIFSSHIKSGAVLSVSSIVVPDFDGDFKIFSDFGKIVRGEDGKIKSIVEIKDATEAEKQIKEINVSYYCFNAKWLWENIDKVENKNSSKEYYLTDLVKMAFADNQRIGSYVIKDPIEGIGVNTIDQLKIAEEHCRIALPGLISSKIAEFLRM